MGSTSVASDVRRMRWAREAAARSRFVSGDDLHETRLRIADLVRELADAARSSSSPSSAAARRRELLLSNVASMNDRDPEFAYVVSKDLMDRAISDGDADLAMEYRTKMEDARSCMPQLNLHGLWVGK